jgi:type III pantothenate kinase
MIDHRRLRTVRDQTADEWGVLLRSPVLRSARSTSPRWMGSSSARRAAARLSLALMAQRYFHTGANNANRTDTGLTIRYDNP